MSDPKTPATSAHFRERRTPPVGSPLPPPTLEEARSRAERLVQQRRADVEQAERERRRLKAFPVLAVATPLVALPFSWQIAAGLFATWLCFWGVGAYLNFFHRRDCAQKLRDAEQELRAHQAAEG